MKPLILVTGSDGLLGSAIQRVSVNFPNYNFVFVSKKQRNLCNINTVEAMFQDMAPEYVIHAAGIVSGESAEVFAANVVMNTLIANCCVKYRARKLVAFTHPAVYSPDLQVADEELLQEGSPHNAVGESGRVLDRHLRMLNEKYKTNHALIIPATMYGVNDRFNLNCTRFIPGCIHRCVLANGDGMSLVLPSDGTPVREVVYADDVAHLAIRVMEDKHSRNRINITSKQQVSFQRIAETVCHEMKMSDRIEWSGALMLPKRFPPMSNKNIDFSNKNFIYTDFSEGIRTVVKDFRKSYPKVRR